jgi:hypothetical protein
MVKIAVLAWGSLVWDRRGLSVNGDFKPIGPNLPVEFCRMSRDGRLTLVIDETVGANCLTYAAMSAFDNLIEAKENLRQREDMPSVKGIGFVDLISGQQSDRAKQRHPNSVKTIADWTRANGFEATIWTALANNFNDPKKAEVPFSVEAAIRHLDGLDKLTFAKAIRYIRSAPPEIQTPGRTAVSQRWPEE